MRNPMLVLIFVVVLLLAACTRPAPPSTPPPSLTPEEAQIQPYPVEATLTPHPTNTALPTLPVEEATEVIQPTEAPTDEPSAEAPEATDPAASPTATTAAPTEIPAATNTPVASPTATLPPVDPVSAFGPADFTDPMRDFASETNWRDEGFEMPDTDFIQLTIEDDELAVTGKIQYFDTWYFTWPVLDDFYLKMDVSTDTCTGRDAYGLITRGPLRGTGESWGYIVAFSCDGQFLLRRVDSADPYATVDLVPWTSNENIKSGPNQTNILGFEAQGDTLTIYANNFQIAQIEDDKYGQGRYGVFVSGAQTPNFTYQVDELSYWDLQ
jgi:hypothetical protein